MSDLPITRIEAILEVHRLEAAMTPEGRALAAAKLTRYINQQERSERQRMSQERTNAQAHFQTTHCECGRVLPRAKCPVCDNDD